MKSSKKIQTPDFMLERLLSICRNYEHACLLVSNNKDSEFDFLVGIGAKKIITHPEEIDLKQKDYLFGHISYDLKNKFEQLVSNNKDYSGFPECLFFIPNIVIKVKGICTEFLFTDDSSIEIIENTFNDRDFKFLRKARNRIDIKASTAKEEYLKKVGTIKKHIQRGDIYEVNYCINFFAEQAEIDATQTFLDLNELSKSPFACYYKIDDNYLICSSPERFLQKNGNKIISQPIKGTRKRGKDKEEDQQIIQELKTNEKEKNENVMIVDLVRNDLSRIASRGSVNVDELFGIYSFEQVHQMISTISCELKEELSFKNIIKNTFPMGSMTGAPKVSAMKLIEENENFKRGIYSGSVGHISPDGNFDFNVVIRSIIYNNSTQTVSFNVGSAITDKANAEEEYAECLLKAKAMFKVLEE